MPAAARIAAAIAFALRPLWSAVAFRFRLPLRPLALGTRTLGAWPWRTLAVGPAMLGTRASLIAALLFPLWMIAPLIAPRFG
jgi:hypothetical protein